MHSLSFRSSIDDENSNSYLGCCDNKQEKRSFTTIDTTELDRVVKKRKEGISTVILNLLFPFVFYCCLICFLTCLYLFCVFSFG